LAGKRDAHRVVGATEGKHELTITTATPLCPEVSHRDRIHILYATANSTRSDLSRAVIALHRRDGIHQADNDPGLQELQGANANRAFLAQLQCRRWSQWIWKE
jgi:hypothetical protein